MSSVEEIENRMNQTKNILHKYALEGHLNFGLMISDIEYLLNEIKNLVNENNELHREINRRIKLKIENEKSVDNDFVSKNKIREIIQKYYEEYEKEKEYRYTLDVEDEQRLLRKIEKELLNERR